MPSHYLNTCWFIDNWTLRNKLQWKFNQNTHTSIQENASENISGKPATILFRPQHINVIWEPFHKSFELITQIFQKFSSLILILMIRSGRNFAHATTAELSRHVQNCDLIRSLFLKLYQYEFYENWIMSSLPFCPMCSWATLAPPHLPLWPSIIDAVLNTTAVQGHRLLIPFPPSHYFPSFSRIMNYYFPSFSRIYENTSYLFNTMLISDRCHCS